ncbi:hypothetical protein [Spongiibacter tropicus]|uniref:hypothetical protein n=1 Tax=Spongiibacter tropicus TaxID=454602 RepID=UPI0024E21CFE|nr:hypothetical protein [Spongiibacter tropicus]
MTNKLSETKNSGTEKHQAYNTAGTAYEETHRTVCIDIPLELYNAITASASLEGREISETCKLALTQYARSHSEKFAFSQPKRRRERSRYRKLIAEGLQNYVDSHSAIRDKE